ncbi:MAG: 50S ribosomal protein L24 [Planctomycetes bacterium]|nr:50S ribosomal protein L24 [Planctomycetota bacterium]
MLIKTGDVVEVRSGNARGTRAKVLAVRPAKPGSAPGSGGTVVVEGVNRVYRHIRRSQKNPQGGRLSKEMPIDVSNVLFFCTACGKATRLGVRATAEGGKVRFCRKCGAEHGVLRRPRAGAKG